MYVQEQHEYKWRINLSETDKYWKGISVLISTSPLIATIKKFPEANSLLKRYSLTMWWCIHGFVINDRLYRDWYLVMITYLLGWFKDMSRLFLSCPVPKLLLVAGSVLSVSYQFHTTLMLQYCTHNLSVPPRLYCSITWKLYLFKLYLQFVQISNLYFDRCNVQVETV